MKINKAVGEIITDMEKQNLTTDEKIAALKSAAILIENVVTAEHLKAMIRRSLGFRGNDGQ